MRLFIPMAMVILAAPVAQARTYHSHLAHDGVELKVLSTLSSNLYGLVGDAGSFYLTDNVYIGGAGYGGSNLGRDYFGYGGLVVGMEDTVMGPLGYDAHLLVGGGWGSFQSAPQATYYGGGIVVEPSMGVMLKAFDLFRLKLGASALIFPGNPWLSGLTLSLSFH